MKNYFQKILTLFIGNEYPESVRQEFYRWIIDKEHLSEKDKALQNLWKEVLKQTTVPNIHPSYEQARQKTSVHSVRNERKIRPIRVWQAVAAVFFLMAASSIYLSTIGKDAEPNLLQQYIPTAEVRTLTLPDGTEVQLNSRSTLLYPQKFAGKDRSVFLIGEANFKVKPDKTHPFIVKSNDFQVTALGTEFNVSAYPENPVTAATLISGSVLVEYDNLNSQVILKPCEQLAYDKNTRLQCLNNPDMKDITAWQHGELVFREMSIKNIITVLERKYPYTFKYQLKHLKEDKYSFRFKDQATLAEVMDVIVNVVGQMDYKIKENCCYLIPQITPKSKI